ncbi:MAG: hypothetical protein DHS20C18_46820 [Saprospiraceae bacterium]|nr:MAG: hypothetical protein DHS20C18_46820 [Saprospiraceae bacterium]
MTPRDIIHHRLQNQQITGARFKQIEALVSWQGGIQAQDYQHAKWSIGMRLPGIADCDVEQAIADRKIIRSWLMRGTLHIVAAADIHWLLDLVAPRIIASSKGRNRQLGLDESTLERSKAIFRRVLEGGKEFTREEMGTSLQQQGISTEGQRLYHILHRAGLDQVICFGSRIGKQFTFTLLDECVPNKRSMQREEALGEMAKRYFLSRAPATLQDFVWWSGLTVTEAKKGLALVQHLFREQELEGQTYLLPNDGPDVMQGIDQLLLLPAFDEYVIAYRDRSAVLDASQTKSVISKNGIFYPIIVHQGKVIGTWKRTIKKDQVIIHPEPFLPLNEEMKRKIEVAAEGFGGFLGVAVLVKGLV